jgi:hypothetical protein
MKQPKGMKKKWGDMNYLTVEQMEALPTPRLLAYRKKLMKTKWVFDDYVWDCDCSDCKRTLALWREKEDNLEAAKKILDTREHVEERR